MRLTPPLAPFLVLALVAGACSRSDDATDVGNGDPASESAAGGSPDVAEEPRDLGPVYVQHALLGTSTSEDGAVTVTLGGVGQVTTWLSLDGAGSLSTGDFVDRELRRIFDEGLSAQAAIVPDDRTLQPILLELTSADWDGPRRRLVYQGEVPATRDPRLHDLAPERTARLPRVFSASSMYVVPRDPGASPVTSTTTTTTVGPSTSRPSTSSTTTSTPDGGTPPSSSTSTTLLTPPPSPPPAGDAVLVVGPTELSVPNGGGTQVITIRNIGSEVGTWSAMAPLSQGISASPTGGLLFPGSQTQVTIAYDGSQQPRDFAATVTVRLPNGAVSVRVTVRG